MYLIDDTDGFVMIDCGVHGDHYYELLSKKLGEINIGFNEIKLLVGTHMHSDHIGLSEKVRGEGIPFALYKNSIDFLDKYNGKHSQVFPAFSYTHLTLPTSDLV